MTSAEVRDLKIGVYRVYWKEGGSSVAALGLDRVGGFWLAPTNWVIPSTPNWDKMQRMELLATQHENVVQDGIMFPKRLIVSAMAEPIFDDDGIGVKTIKHTIITLPETSKEPVVVFGAPEEVSKAIIDQWPHGVAVGATGAVGQMTLDGGRGGNYYQENERLRAENQRLKEQIVDLNEGIRLNQRVNTFTVPKDFDFVAPSVSELPALIESATKIVIAGDFGMGEKSQVLQAARHFLIQEFGEPNAAQERIK